MKFKSVLRFGLPLIIMLASMLIVSCANHAKAVKSEAPEKEASEQKTAEAPEQEAEKATQSMGVKLYAGEPAAIMPVQCGSCHKGEYKRLQQSDSKHRFDCLKCHTQLHAYVPTKKNYKEIMPKCARCHGMKHGDAFPDCLQCHIDPHSPLNIPFSGVQKKMRNRAGKTVVACEVCHYKPEAHEMEEYPCKHNTEAGCVGCHITGINATKHGMKPTCFACHEPHIQGQTYQDCLVCHRPHSAKHILKYPEDMDNKVCGSCHSTIYLNLQTNHTKHSDLYCATCHEHHGEIPKCQQCHGEPHGEAIHRRFPNCLKCHIDPHNLPAEK